MSRIAFVLVQEALSNQREQLQITGRPDFYYIAEQDVDALMFAVGHVLTMVEEIADGWYKTHGAA